MRLVLTGLLLPLALVAACNEAPAPAEPNPAPAPAAPAVLGGVALDQPVRALGTEPFWGVEITPSELVYSGVDRPERRAPNPGPVMQGTTAVFTAALADGTPLVITLIDTDCSDGMSDRTYPLTARVEVGPETLNGCAAASDFITNTNERGEPRQAAAEAPAEG